jgi:hypothetical protein
VIAKVTAAAEYADTDLRVCTDVLGRSRRNESLELFVDTPVFSVLG